MNQLDTQALEKLAALDAALPGCMLADRLRLGRRIGQVKRARGRRGRRGGSGP